MIRPPTIAIASGKGGTGKTTVAVTLALTAAAAGRRVRYRDCDVEEPNGHLFLKPQFSERRPVTTPIPEVIQKKCNGCGLCAEVCPYPAIAVVHSEVLLFPELCHSCRACRFFCPQGAIADRPRPIGLLSSGTGTGGVSFVQGILDIGQIAAPTVIRAVASLPFEGDLDIRDCPPGVSCPVIEAVKDADAVLLVTEPTPFGLHDLVLAVEMTRALHLPFAVILNRAGMGNDETETYCRREGIPIVLSIPDDRRIAQAYAEGTPFLEALPDTRGLFDKGLERILALTEARHP
jgi:MinD superfamily P-loop ATPase